MKKSLLCLGRAVRPDACQFYPDASPLESEQTQHPRHTLQTMATPPKASRGDSYGTHSQWMQHCKPSGRSGLTHMSSWQLGRAKHSASINEQHLEKVSCCSLCLISLVDFVQTQEKHTNTRYPSGNSTGNDLVRNCSFPDTHRTSTQDLV